MRWILLVGLLVSVLLIAACTQTPSQPVTGGDLCGGDSGAVDDGETMPGDGM